MFNLKLAERQAFFISYKDNYMQIYYYHNDESNTYSIMNIEEILPPTYYKGGAAILFTYKGNYHSATEKDYSGINYLESNYYSRFFEVWFKFYSKPIPEDKEALKQAFNYLFN